MGGPLGGTKKMPNFSFFEKELISFEREFKKPIFAFSDAAPRFEKMHNAWGIPQLRSRMLRSLGKFAHLCRGCGEAFGNSPTYVVDVEKP